MISKTLAFLRMPVEVILKTQKFPLTFLFAISAMLFISIAILMLNHGILDSVVEDLPSSAGENIAGASDSAQLGAAKVRMLRAAAWAMGGLFLALTGFVVVADVVIRRANLREIALVEEQLAERKRFEEQLLQGQKMESIGRLAGGVAHDFNNLLTPIVSYAQLSIMNLEPGDPLRSNMEEIQRAAERAADITHKLLAFSRQQVIEPKVIDLNHLVIDLGKLLQRLIGEDIEMSIVTSPNVGMIKVEPGQIEQVLVNLAVNARDAMPGGGKLTIKTDAVYLDGEDTNKYSDLVLGKYVLLAVSDTGIGMTDEVKRHIFEPFFTTKGAGKGTGLGLSTCYGIVKQSGGDLSVDSEPGKGSTIKIYLPQAEEYSIEPILLQDTPLGLPKGTETVLLAEDEAAVRDVAAQMLREQGYNVLPAANGAEALGVAWMYASEKIDLLLTDVIMPQMNGKELADQLSAIHPEARVLYTSGYTDDTIGRHGVLSPDTQFLQKPFSPPDLAYKVREVLDNRN